MNEHTSPHPYDRAAPIALWRIAEAFMRTLASLFGDPADIAMGVAITKHARDLMTGWLRVAEAMLRRLLLVEAAAITDLPTPRPRRAHKLRQRAVMLADADKPETWRVSFRCFPARRKPRIASAARRRLRNALPDGYLLNAAPIARRYEALIRVFNDPAPFARRLALRLRQIPDRVSELFRAPADAVHKLGEEALSALTSAASQAACAPDSS